MNKRKLLSISCIALTTLLGGAWFGFHQSASAHGFKVGDLSVEHPYANATVAGSKNGAAYFKAIHNHGKTPDRLISAKSIISNSIELHTMRMDGNVMRMREVNSIELPAGSATVFGQGTENGYHVMLMGLKEPLKEGEQFKLLLRFEKAGDLEVPVTVQKAKAGADIHKHH